MLRLKSFFQSLGLFSKQELKKPYDYNISNYDISKNKKLILHKEYLKEIEYAEDNRLNIIESKTSQIISQTGLIFSLISLFIPFIIDKVLEFSFFLKAIFILVLALAFLFYILTINNALKNFNVKNFRYIKSSPNSILTNQKLDVNDFVKMEIKDSLRAINNNIAINNIKGTNLISAYNSFRLANFSTSVLVLFLCASLLFTNPKTEEISVSNPIEIEHFKEYIETLKEQNLILKEKLRTISSDTIGKGTTIRSVSK